MLRLSYATGRKFTAYVLAVLGFILLYGVSIRDSQQSAHDPEPTTLPAPGATLRFAATAYCRGTTTTSGVRAQRGIAAADPALLPVGSVVAVNSLGPAYNGIYTVMDTGPRVQGRELDLYMWSCKDAVKFGRRQVKVTVLRLGWNPRGSSPGLRIQD